MKISKLPKFRRQKEERVDKSKPVFAIRPVFIPIISAAQTVATSSRKSLIPSCCHALDLKKDSICKVLQQGWFCYWSSTHTGNPSTTFKPGLSTFRHAFVVVAVIVVVVVVLQRNVLLGARLQFVRLLY